jgi:hypothetical protein
MLPICPFPAILGYISGHGNGVQLFIGGYWSREGLFGGTREAETAICNAACSSLRFAASSVWLPLVQDAREIRCPPHFPPKHLASLYCRRQVPVRTSQKHRSGQSDRQNSLRPRGNGSFHMTHVRYSCVALSHATRPDKSWRETHVNILRESWDLDFDKIQIPGKQSAFCLIELCINVRHIDCLGTRV